MIFKHDRHQSVAAITVQTQ